MTPPSRVAFLFVLISFLMMSGMMPGERTHSGQSLSRFLDLTKLPGCETSLLKADSGVKLSPSTAAEQYPDKEACLLALLLTIPVQKAPAVLLTFSRQGQWCHCPLITASSHCKCLITHYSLSIASPVNGALGSGKRRGQQCLGPLSPLNYISCLPGCT